jgi:hypothetical protein
MELILTESQYVKLLTEEKKNEINETFKESTSLVKKIIKDVKQEYGLHFTFALTWGPIIGGLVGPVSKYIHSLHPELSSSDLTLILFGVIVTFFSSSKELVQNTMKVIKQKKLIRTFDSALAKTYDLRDAFFDFLKSLNITFSKVSSMLAYTFLVPLVPLIKDFADLNVTTEHISMIVNGITGLSATVISRSILIELLTKMIKRFRS